MGAIPRPSSGPIGHMDELRLLESLAARHGHKARIWACGLPPPCRGIPTLTSIPPGPNSKFGLHIENGQAAEAIRYVCASAWLDLVGLHTHLGSRFFLS